MLFETSLGKVGAATSGKGAGVLGQGNSDQKGNLCLPFAFFLRVVSTSSQVTAVRRHGAVPLPGRGDLPAAGCAGRVGGDRRLPQRRAAGLRPRGAGRGGGWWVGGLEVWVKIDVCPKTGWSPFGFPKQPQKGVRHKHGPRWFGEKIQSTEVLEAGQS